MEAGYLPRLHFFRIIAVMRKIDTKIPVDEGQRMLLASSLAQTAAIFYVNSMDNDITEDAAIDKAIEMYADVLDRLEDALPSDSEEE